MALSQKTKGILSIIAGFLIQFVIQNKNIFIIQLLIR
jgi:hypothetical protein